MVSTSRAETASSMLATNESVSFAPRGRVYRTMKAIFCSGVVRLLLIGTWVTIAIAGDGPAALAQKVAEKANAGLPGVIDAAKFDNLQAASGCGTAGWWSCETSARGVHNHRTTRPYPGRYRVSWGPARPRESSTPIPKASPR